MKYLFLIALLPAMLPLAAVAEKPFAIYSPKDGLADGWKATTWAGPVVSQVESATSGSTMLQVTVESGSQAYSGVELTANQGGAVDLSDTLRETGAVKIHLKPGKTAGGQAATEAQPVQIGLTFLSKTGETVHGNFNTQTKVEPLEAGTEVTFTLPEALKGVKDVDQLASISGVRLQFCGEPVSGFTLIECTIKN